jgi:uncharacterized membrane protein (DUF485 family)
MLRPALTILIGTVLALLMAFAALFIVVPIVGKGGQGIAQAVAVLVFAGMLVFVVTSVVRARRPAEGEQED